ncbi:potassium channel family protein [Occallatibacter riparius]|uniref:Potassium channel family protein n=1 Tax=Occallatibacter riparius TaxID=1002689 RepID=A0A9J7BKJ2_9BACT|nr:potassium channel family protein [Occallatibacter riparius]UWZ82961.1 potassium channel family protein [Occallatibacter riparius]
MRIFTLIAGVFCVVIVLVDAFQTIISPRRAAGPVRLTRWFYLATWHPWAFLAKRIRDPRGRETAFSFYGPLSLILLLAFWAAVILFGFGLIYFSLGTSFWDSRERAGLMSDLYMSGSAIFTLGPEDAGPTTPLARMLVVLEAGTGFAFLAVVMGYFPVLYGAFSRREVSISLLDARAGSPPTAAELMRRHAHDGADTELSTLLIEWERWSAELLESHISFPLLCYFRSQHTNQSWISALTAILDTCALLIAGVQGHEARQAQLTFAMARHAMVDLSQVVSLRPIEDAPDRLTQARYDELYGLLCQSGVSVCRDTNSENRLREMRKLYEPYAEALSAHFQMALPPWIAQKPHKDNWLTVAKVRASAEKANPKTTKVAGESRSSVDLLLDDHHDF